jgi:hypothetical protein
LLVERVELADGDVFVVERVLDCDDDDGDNELVLAAAFDELTVEDAEFVEVELVAAVDANEVVVDGPFVVIGGIKVPFLNMRN